MTIGAVLRRRGYQFLLLFGCLVAALQPANAMDFARHADHLLLSGKVVREDFAAFQAAVAEGPVTTVVFTNNGGGDLWAGLKIAKIIESLGLNTAVAGRCASACALMFMGGKDRRMVGGKGLAQTRLGFHGPHRKSTKEVSRTGAGLPKTREWLLHTSGGKFSGPLLDKAMEIENAGDMLYFYHPLHAPGPVAPPSASTATISSVAATAEFNGEPTAPANSVWFCKEGVRPRPLACQTTPDANAWESGILTTVELMPPPRWLLTSPQR